MKTLQEITDAFGQWIARSNPESGGLLFSASTNYSRISDFERYKVNVSTPEFRYLPVQLAPTEPIGSVASIFKNDSSVEQKQSFRHSETVERSFSWSTTQSIEVGISISMTVGIPKVAEVEGSVSTTMSLSSTEGSSKTLQKTFDVSLEVTVPPYTTLSAQQIVLRQPYNIPWTAETVLMGSVALWFNNRWPLHGDQNDKHFLWFVPIAEMFRVCAEVSLVDLTGYENLGYGVKAIATGMFTGSQGVRSDVEIRPLPSPASQDAAPAPRTIPIGPDGGPAIIGVDPADGGAPPAGAELETAGAGSA